MVVYMQDPLTPKTRMSQIMEEGRWSCNNVAKSAVAKARAKLRLVILHLNALKVLFLGIYQFKKGMCEEVELFFSPERLDKDNGEPGTVINYMQLQRHLAIQNFAPKDGVSAV